MLLLIIDRVPTSHDLAFTSETDMPSDGRQAQDASPARPGCSPSRMGWSAPWYLDGLRPGSYELEGVAGQLVRDRPPVDPH